MSFRILHIDDDPHVRSIVKLAFGRDPTLVVMSAASGDETLAKAAAWAPHLILCDAAWAGMEPALLARLRQSARSADIPVVFTAASVLEPGQMKSLSAVGVIANSLDPSKLADTVRRHLRVAKLATASHHFGHRMRTDATVLAVLREKLRNDSDSSVLLGDLSSCAHKLAGAAGIFGFQAASSTASALEDEVVERIAGRSGPDRVETKLDALVECIARECDGFSSNKVYPT